MRHNFQINAFTAIDDIMPEVDWMMFKHHSDLLTHLPLDKMTAISQTVFLNAFS